MKQLRLHNESYKALVSSFKEWLSILGFCDGSVYYLPLHLQEFFYYLEKHHITSIDQISRVIIKQYYNYLSSRPNQRTSGALSKSSLNSHGHALKKFREYLKKHTAHSIPLHLKPERVSGLKHVEIASIHEVKQLFKATQHSSIYKKVAFRDKAMLVLLYSCGLRRNEAINIKIKDVLFDKQLLLVRKGKNYKERYIPINSYNLQILEHYIYDIRIQFCNYHISDFLLIGRTGNPLLGGGLITSLGRIINATGNQELIDKNITPHKLRHAIASHFLAAGMHIEDIKVFLGHSSLETTQIYTHLIKRIS